MTNGFEPVLARQIALTRPGMAHFAATGPFGTTCKDCALYGYPWPVKNAAGDVVKTKFRKGACRKYRELVHKHGEPIPPDTESCRHFLHRGEAR